MNDPINWQTPAALAIVLITGIAFVLRTLHRRRTSGKSGCGENCGCSVKPPNPSKSPLLNPEESAPKPDSNRRASQ